MLVLMLMILLLLLLTDPLLLLMLLILNYDESIDEFNQSFLPVGRSASIDQFFAVSPARKE